VWFQFRVVVPAGYLLRQSDFLERRNKMTRKLKCSFCGKDETQVAKLVAGGKKNILRLPAYICDECVSIGHDIMSKTEPPAPATAAQQIRVNKKLIRAVGSFVTPARLVMAVKA
jgi:hypothetical protein